MPMSNINHDLNKDLHREVEEALNQNQEMISFEALPHQEDSPLNQAVVDKESIHSRSESNGAISKEEVVSSDKSSLSRESGEAMKKESIANPNSPPTPNDAPEQVINESYSEYSDTETDKGADKESNFELPLSHAKQAADTVLGVTNNIIEVGGGYFVKIRKHKEFYEFEEIITIVEKQNEKNVQRIKLDKEDQLLLRPLLIQILKTKAQELTPEQQLMAAILSIGMKKVQVVMELRNENEILVERILDIVRSGTEDEEGENDTGNDPENDPENKTKEDKKGGSEKVVEVKKQVAKQELIVEPEIISSQSQSDSLVIPSLHPVIDPLISPQQIMEIAVDDSEK